MGATQGRSRRDVVIAIDLGGTKVAVATVTAGGEVLGRSIARTPDGSPAHAIAGFRVRALRLPGAERAVGVGLALPAIVSDTGRVDWAAQSVPTWGGFQAAEALADTFGLPASVDFDGYAATAAEAVFGAAEGARVACVCIVGTGFGAGIWYEGRVVRASVGVAGAVGHLRWPVGDGALSEPAESIASGPGIVAEARRRAPDRGWPDARAVFAAAGRGDTAARGAIAHAALVAGVVAGSLIDAVGPDVVVWSGGVGSRASFADAASRAARRSCQPFAIGRTRFVRSRLGVESSLMGAAAGALAVAQGRERP
jgi:predicted NBD/HSP70 family sugar kinase